MSEIFRKMERNGPGGIRGESVGQDVPLPARPHQLLSETDAAEGLHFFITKLV